MQSLSYPKLLCILESFLNSLFLWAVSIPIQYISVLINLFFIRSFKLLTLIFCLIKLILNDYKFWIGWIFIVNFCIYGIVIRPWLFLEYDIFVLYLLRIYIFFSGRSIPSSLYVFNVMLPNYNTQIQYILNFLVQFFFHILRKMCWSFLLCLELSAFLLIVDPLCLNCKFLYIERTFFCCQT